MNIIVVGCGRLGAELSYRLYKRNHHVAVVDSERAAFYNLPNDFQGRTIEGGAMDQDVLHRAGIEHADGLAAVTNSDAVNAVVGHLASTQYHVSHVVVRNYDPAWRELYETFGLQIVSSTSWGAQRIEELIYHENIRSVFSAGNGEVEIYELEVTEPFNNHPIMEVLTSEQCVPMSVTRAGRALLPTGEMVLQTGDLVHFSATLEGVEKLRKSLRTQERGA